jgi:hypothetical protein
MYIIPEIPPRWYFLYELRGSSVELRQYRKKKGRILPYSETRIPLVVAHGVVFLLSFYSYSSKKYHSSTSPRAESAKLGLNGRSPDSLNKVLAGENNQDLWILFCVAMVGPRIY